MRYTNGGIDILHGFIFSLFFTRWLESSGPKEVFLAVGGIQMGCLLFSIPMYIYGKFSSWYELWTKTRINDIRL